MKITIIKRGVAEIEDPTNIEAHYIRNIGTINMTHCPANYKKDKAVPKLTP